MHEFDKLMSISESPNRRLLSSDSVRLKLRELVEGGGGSIFLGFGVRTLGCAEIFIGTLNVGKSLRGAGILSEFFDRF